MTEISTDLVTGATPETLLAAAQTVGLVAYARQHVPKINGLWVLPACVAGAFIVCFTMASGGSFGVQFVQRTIAVSLLAFSAMVLRRGGNAAPSKPVTDDGGQLPPPLPPPKSFPSVPEASPVTSALMHAVPLMLFGALVLPVIVKLIGTR